MNVSFDLLTVGKEYSRPDLAKRWGLKSHHGLSRGVFTPRNQNLIILFVTKIKQPGNIQYRDFIANDTLYWEGESGHGNDSRIRSAADNGDQIHLFYREIHHTNFAYSGIIHLVSSTILSTASSQFTFLFETVRGTGMVAEPGLKFNSEQHRRRLPNFTVSQIRKWGRYLVTDCSEIKLLRASRIKPTSVCSDHERDDVQNGFLLSPTYDTLFRKGFITFENSGQMLVDDSFPVIEREKLRLRQEDRLKQSLSEETASYLEYHRDTVFGIFKSR